MGALCGLFVDGNMANTHPPFYGISILGGIYFTDGKYQAQLPKRFLAMLNQVLLLQQVSSDKFANDYHEYEHTRKVML